MTEFILSIITYFCAVKGEYDITFNASSSALAFAMEFPFLLNSSISCLTVK